MPSNLKRMVRARMAATGEGWQAALRFVRSQDITRQPHAGSPRGITAPSVTSPDLAAVDGSVAGKVSTAPLETADQGTSGNPPPPSKPPG